MNPFPLSELLQRIRMAAMSMEPQRLVEAEAILAEIRFVLWESPLRISENPDAAALFRDLSNLLQSASSHFAGWIGIVSSSTSGYTATGAAAMTAIPVSGRILAEA